MSVQDPTEFAVQCMSVYYKRFAESRPQMAELYADKAQLSWGEGSISAVGRDQIGEKFNNMGFQKVQFFQDDLKFVAQLTTDNKVLVTVNGRFQTDDDRPLSFAHTLVMSTMPPLVENDVFRVMFPSS